MVCDGLGVGAAPDAAAFGDAGVDTLGHVLARTAVQIPNLLSLGLGQLTAGDPGAPAAAVRGAFAKMSERSAGKDTATGHWELMGLVTTRPFPTFPDGFPEAILGPFEQRIGRRVLGNKAASGTEILKELGEEHLHSGRPIVYTSGDSVFQIAAHESVVPVEDLYAMCRVAYEIACERHGVCRVIARPFVGSGRSDFKRTAHRRDFALPPHGETLLDRLSRGGLTVYGVGKIADIFSGRGLSRSTHTHSDSEGFDCTVQALGEVEHGLIFVNLVDFDTLYGHRNDVAGFAANLAELDRRLPRLLEALEEDDIFMLTADHGGDPTDRSTDHSREYVPWLIYGPRVVPGRNLGVRSTFADLGATLADNFGVGPLSAGTSVLDGL